MNQYEDQKRRNQNRNNQEIEHGLGIGGGRGRPKGSRNGYISPGAAYMKDYEIIGQRADPNQPIPMNRSSMLNNYPRQSRPQPVPRNPSPRLRNNQKAAVKAVTSMTANPARSVEFGRNMLEQVLGAGMEKAGRLADAAQKSIEGNPMPWLNEMYVEPATSAARAIGNAINSANGKTSNEYQQELAYNSQKNGTALPTSATARSVGKSTNNANGSSEYQQELAYNSQKNGTSQPANTPARSVVMPNGNSNGSDEYQQELAYNSQKNNFPQQMSAPAAEPAAEQSKSFWDNLADWGNRAAKDIGDFATRAIDTGKSAYNTAAGWVNDRVNDVGSWAGTAYKDVSDWVGARSRDLFGYDVDQSPSATKEGHQMNGEHVNGFFDNAGNWISTAAQNVGNAVTGAYNDATKWVGDTAGNVGKALFGYDVNQTPSGTKEGHQMNGEHVNGFFDNAGNWISNAAQNVGNAATNVWNGATQWAGQAAQDVGNAVTGAANQTGRWIGDTAKNVGGAIDQAGRWIGDTANNVGRAVTGAVDQTGKALLGYDDVQGGTHYLDQLKGPNAGNAPTMLEGPATRQTNHVNSVFENAANGLDRWWNGDQVIRGDANRVTSIEGNPGMRDRLQDAYDAVVSAVTQGADWTKQQIYDPVSNVFVNVGDFLMGAIGRPAAKAAAAGQEAAANAVAEGQNRINELGQNIADEVNNRVIQPVQQGLRDAQAEYNFNRMYGDARSSNMLNGGVSDNVVQGINRMAANIEITENQRDNLMDAANYAMAKGVPFEQINDWYALVENGQMSPQLFASRVTGLADMSTDVIRDMQRRYGYIK